MDWLTLFIYAAPVALAAIGETVVQRAGVINIGLEGAMLCGAFFAMLVSFTTKSPWIGLAAGASAGVAVNAIFGWFTVYLCSDQVVVGTAVNLFALGLTGTLYRGKFGQSGQLLTVPTLPSWHGVDPLMALMVLSVPVVWALLSRSACGLAVRAAGEYPKAAEAAGFSVHRLRFMAVLVGGLFAGLGGSYLSIVITGTFAENMSAGRGFVAIAMVTFGRWRPALVFLAALLIGFAESLQFRFQALGWKVPFQLMIALPYLIALAVLVIVGKGTVAPAALGISYRRER
ncbi:ABC transporter permease [Fimbriimonas ginsengisoli]|uniref:Sugar ABC transporter permease protein n=1 Tax=Fimbriimonas ginsengisoli Gsoil 348 TaxID=661478 RepID=A0A068NXW9_FIMGI|nr:ABC transporter permease [Fimbriimonas ginsengisoli]AIE87640.1 sugar ABC transporter permease protein [Fimbriimonas ginsengisoli Gsoil 348]